MERFYILCDSKILSVFEPNSEVSPEKGGMFFLPSHMIDFRHFEPCPLYQSKRGPESQAVELGPDGMKKHCA